MNEDSQDQPTWGDYYKATADRPASPLLMEALGRFDAPGFVIDLGCGAGTESLELLARGWRVLAIDNEPEAIAHLLARVPPELRARLETQVVSFQEMALPQADLIWAGLSLPFCPPAHFDSVWEEIVRALQPGGRFAGHIFGDRHAWLSEAEMTFLTAEALAEKLRGMEIESLVEKDEEGKTAFQGVQRLHAFLVIARKPG